MTSMYLESRLLLEQGGEADTDYPIDLQYYLLESELSIEEELKGIKTYGVGIIKKTQEECTEAKFVEALSCCLASTKEVLSLLVRNSVTPVSLHDVLEDIVGV